jgi:hypothetical protein
MHRTRNAAYGQPYREFESPPLRHFLIEAYGIKARIVGWIYPALTMAPTSMPRSRHLAKPKIT